VEQHWDDPFDILSIAMEHTGAESARPFVERAGATFVTVVDEHGATSQALGFKAIPNGVLVDEEGVIRWAKYGGFSIDNEDDVAVVERFLSGEAPGESPASAQPYTLGEVERELIDTKLRLGRLLDERGRREEAIKEWTDALHLDTQNLVIRKQIWMARYPEKFHPEIDWDWQKEQLTKEREAEIAAGICGPDGCPLPRGDDAQR
jgi:hypothetical protein